MAEEYITIVNIAFEKAVEKKRKQGKILSLVSNDMGVFDPALRVDIPVTEAGAELYKVAKSDWNTTLGGIFERMDKTVDRGHPYEQEQDEDLETLSQCFSSGSPGMTETNRCLSRLVSFTEISDGADMAMILVSRAQLQALVNVARREIESSRRKGDITQDEKEFYQCFVQKNGVRYSHGLVNSLA